MTTLTLDQALTRAREIGARWGKDAATDLTNNGDTDRLCEIRRGIEDGDPEVLDALPQGPDLSVGDLAEEIGVGRGDLAYWQGLGDDLADAYREGFAEALQGAISAEAIERLHGLVVDTVAEKPVDALALLADCAVPDSPTSPGAAFLRKVAEGVGEILQGLDPSDVVTLAESGTRMLHAPDVDAIAEGAPDPMTATRWAQFVDLQAWTERPEYDQWSGEALAQIARSLAAALLDEAQTTLADLLA
jgi:hypothetical protein